uniref:Uncharacterized protein n=1 Tax=Glaukea argentea TaxID=2894057 RepID=A0A386B1L1_9CHLO|nr:hypothetical protein [Udotea argentea]AYC65595.1 hypothetical protein [Udotea argentea]
MVYSNLKESLRWQIAAPPYRANIAPQRASAPFTPSTKSKPSLSNCCNILSSIFFLFTRPISFSSKIGCNPIPLGLRYLAPAIFLFRYLKYFTIPGKSTSQGSI